MIGTGSDNTTSTVEKDESRSDKQSGYKGVQQAEHKVTEQQAKVTLNALLEARDKQCQAKVSALQQARNSVESSKEKNAEDESSEKRSTTGKKITLLDLLQARDSVESSTSNKGTGDDNIIRGDEHSDRKIQEVKDDTTNESPKQEEKVSGSPQVRDKQKRARDERLQQERSNRAGTLVSAFLFSSTMLTVKRIQENKSVEEFKSDPCLASTISGLFWILYCGIGGQNISFFLVGFANGLGSFYGFFALTIFLIYGGFLSYLPLGIFVGIAYAAYKVFHTHTRMSTLTGCFSVFFGILQYASPLTIMRNVVKNKSVEYMPFYLSLFYFLNGIIWTIFSCLVFNVYICVTNGAGILLGGLQLVLYWHYSKKTQKVIDDPDA